MPHFYNDRLEFWGGQPVRFQEPGGGVGDTITDAVVPSGLRCMRCIVRAWPSNRSSLVMRPPGVAGF